MTIATRRMVDDDRQFVISGWSSSFRTSRYAGIISNARWANVMHREIGDIIAAPTTSVIVACEPGEPDHRNREFLYGFIAVRSTGAPYVYYCYVKLGYTKPGYRRRGIARKLFAAAGIDPSEPFGFAAGTDLSDRILATCKCGLQRRDHLAETDCQRFVPKFRGVMDPVPAREAA